MTDDIEEVPVDEIDPHRGIQGVQGVQGIAGPQGVAGTAATPEAVARAAELKEALAENTKALNRVKRRQFITTGSLIGLTIAYVVLAILFFRVRDAQDTACDSGNNVRTGLLHMADVFEGSLSEPRADGRPRTAREVEQIEDFVAGLRDDFALRDCGS